MKKFIISLIVVVIIFLAIRYATKTAVITPSPSPSVDLSNTYIGSGFTIQLPLLATSTASTSEAYTVLATHTYQASPIKIIPGVRFTVPSSIATGTNLSSDTYISVETLPAALTSTATSSCSADMFFDGVHKTIEQTINGVDYSVASSSGAGAGNRYEETVYALPSTQPCRGVRYLIHYGVLQNYPEGTVQEFDKAKLITEFDAIRDTVKVGL